MVFGAVSFHTERYLAGETKLVKIDNPEVCIPVHKFVFMKVKRVIWLVLAFFILIKPVRWPLFFFLKTRIQNSLKLNNPVRPNPLLMRFWTPGIPWMAPGTRSNRLATWLKRSQTYPVEMHIVQNSA
jgi:hypothetical protein